MEQEPRQKEAFVEQEQEQRTFQQFDQMGEKNIEMMIGALDVFRQINQGWISSLHAEMALASEYFAKLAAAKSIPDAAIVYQSCANRQMEILAENGRQLMTASEKMMPKLFGNGLGGAGT